MSGRGRRGLGGRRAGSDKASSVAWVPGAKGAAVRVARARSPWHICPRSRRPTAAASSRAGASGGGGRGPRRAWWAAVSKCSQFPAKIDATRCSSAWRPAPSGGWWNSSLKAREGVERSEPILRSGKSNARRLQGLGWWGWGRDLGREVDGVEPRPRGRGDGWFGGQRGVRIGKAGVGVHAAGSWLDWCAGGGGWWGTVAGRRAGGRAVFIGRGDRDRGRRWGV